MRHIRKAVCSAVLFVTSCTTTSTAVLARVVDVQTSRESVMYVVATLEMENTGTNPCRVSRYTLSWPGGSKAVTPDDLLVAPGSSAERTLRVDPSDGDLGALTGAAAMVEATCE